MGEPKRSGRGFPRWLVLWLGALNVGLLALSVGLAYSTSRRAWFLAFLVLVAIVPFSYARLRLHRFLEDHLAGRAPRLMTTLAALSVLLDTILMAQLVTGRSSGEIPVLQGPGVNWVGPVWFSSHALLFLGYGAIGLVRALRKLVVRLWTRVAPRSDETSAQSDLASPSRRVFLQRAGLVGAGVPFGISLSGVPLSYDLRVEKHEITLPGWPRSLDGLRVVHLSDIHVGGGMTRERLLHMAELVQSCQPDLVLHTGDFLTHREGEFDLPLYEALARIHAPYGQWACLGNHDYDNPGRFVRLLAQSGVVTLRDRVETIAIHGQPIEIAGADFVFDRSARGAVLSRVVSSWGPRKEVPRILLNHDPSTFAELPDGCADLVLSGHTHGGHVGIQLGPELAFTVVGMVGLPDQGLFSRGDMKLFVTRCVGFYGYPMRVGIPPEVALLILRAPVPTGTPA